MTSREPPLTRRGFLAAAAAAAFAAACGTTDEPRQAQATEPTRGAPPAAEVPTQASTPVPTPTAVPAAEEPPGLRSALDTARFPYGVASGDPTPESVILWTRGEFGLGGSDAALGWAVASDRDFDTIVAAGDAVATEAFGYTVHVDAGGLDPGTWYWYKFFGEAGSSPVGRTRTMPAPDSLEPVRFGFSSCQNLEQGWYAAHRHLAEADLDLFIWLGDYIYEQGPTEFPIESETGEVRVHTSAEVTTLDEYRARYGLYKSDLDLQAHHASRPWIVTWDDHEVENGYAGNNSENGDSASDFRARRAAAYQAWYENMPVRLTPPQGPDYRIHRTLAWGELVQFNVLDGRQYRANQPIDGERIVVPGLADGRTVVLRVLGPNALDPTRSMLGAEQERWLIEAVNTASATWQALVQSVLMSGVNVLPAADPPVTFTDTWDGYAGSRRRLVDSLAEATDNLVVLTGDFHSGAVADLRSNPFDREAPVVATEFMASSISSRFPEAAPAVLELLKVFNPHVRHFDPANGYVICDVDAERWQSRYFAVDDVLDRASNVRETVAFEVQAGTPGARPT